MDGCERTQSIQSEKGRDVNNRIKKTMDRGSCLRQLLRSCYVHDSIRSDPLRLYPFPPVVCESDEFPGADA